MAKVKYYIIYYQKAIHYNIAMQTKLTENTKCVFFNDSGFAKCYFCKNQTHSCSLLIYKSPYFLSSNVDTNFVTCVFCKKKSILKYYYDIILCIFQGHQFLQNNILELLEEIAVQQN